MKTTRILIPVLTLAAASLLMAQATPGSTPAPKGNTPAPAPPPAPPEAFPAPGDPLPAAPAPQAPAAVPPAPAPAAPVTPAIIPNPPPAVLPPTVVGPTVPAPAGGQLIVPNPLATTPAPAVANPVNEPRADPFIGAGTINGVHVSARGKATIFSSLVFQFTKNEPVNIFEEILLKKPKASEPRIWLRVQMPQDTGVWVHGQFLSAPFTQNIINAQGQAVPVKYAQVTANRLNIRGHAGENHPVLGRLEKGATVRLSTNKKGKWVELFAPANASVYVAAQFVTRVPLNQGVVEVPGPGQSAVIPPVTVNPIPPVAGGTQTPAPVGPVLPPTPVGPTSPTTPAETIVTIPSKAFGQPNGVTENGVPIKQATKPKGINPTTPGQPTTPSIVEVKPTEPITPTPPVQPIQPVEPIKVAKVIETNPNLPPASTQKPGATEPPVRIVTREGIVRRTRAPQAPSGYILEHLESGKKINYLLLNHATLKLNWFIGQRVLVSGQEAIDARQANTPVLKVKTLKGDVSPKAIKELTLAQARKQDPPKTENSAKPEPEPAPAAPKPEGTTPKALAPEAPVAPKPESTTPKAPAPEAPEAPKPESTTPKAPAPEAPSAPKPEGTVPKAPAPEAPSPIPPKKSDDQ